MSDNKKNGTTAPDDSDPPKKENTGANRKSIVRGDKQKINDLVEAGFSLVPVHPTGHPKAKDPRVSAWSHLQRTPMTKALVAQYTNKIAFAIICGKVSGGTQCIDFDLKGKQFEEWKAIVEENRPGLVDRLCIQRTPSTGYHALYKTDPPVEKSTGKLNKMRVTEELIPFMKSSDVLKYYMGERDYVNGVEQKGEGGYFVCHPTAGYEIIQGDLCDLPVLSIADHEMMRAAAASLSDYHAITPDFIPAADTELGDHSVVGDFNQQNRDKMNEILRAMGWKPESNVMEATTDKGDAIVQRWTRPDKKRGTSGTWFIESGVFYCFTSSDTKLEENKYYTPFDLITLHKFDGKQEAAIEALKAQGYGVQVQPATHIRVADEYMYFSPAVLNPGGALQELMDYGAKAYHDYHPVLNLAAAIANIGTMGGYHIRTGTGLCTNTLLLAVTLSGSGKGSAVRQAADGLRGMAPEKLVKFNASSETGIMGIVQNRPVVLFVSDELGMLLTHINNRSSPNYSMMRFFLEHYTEHNGVSKQFSVTTKVKNIESRHDCVSLFGTTTPETLFNAFESGNITSGLIPRMLIFYVDPDEAVEKDFSIMNTDSVVEFPSELREFGQRLKREIHKIIDNGEARAEGIDPDPVDRYVRVPFATDAAQLLAEYRLKYKKRARTDEQMTEIYKRAAEQANRLSLIHAVSAQYPITEAEQGTAIPTLIGLSSVEWAIALVDEIMRWYSTQLRRHLADGPEDVLKQKILRYFEKKHPAQLKKKDVLKAVRQGRHRERKEAFNVLVEEERLVEVKAASDGRLRIFYALGEGYDQ